MSWCGSLWVHLVWDSVFPGPGYVSLFRFRKFSGIISSNTFYSFLAQFCFWDSYNVNVSMLIHYACRCRGHGFEPWSGKIPHAAEQLGPWATTTEPAHLSLCSATGEATIVRGPRTVMKSGPRLPQLEKALAQKRRPNTAKNK